MVGQDLFLNGLELGRGRTGFARICLGVSLALLGAGVGTLLVSVF
ncbi:hypothetical protein [Rubrivirga sp.]